MQLCVSELKGHLHRAVRRELELLERTCREPFRLTNGKVGASDCAVERGLGLDSRLLHVLGQRELHALWRNTR